MRGALVLVVMVGLAGAGCRAVDEPAAQPAAAAQESSMKIQSEAFGHQQQMDPRFTCEGEDRSPPLAWSGAPSGTKSFALIVDDPDAPDPAAPKRVWVHWVLFDIPPSVTQLAENAAVDGLPDGTKVGVNDWKKQAYGGPCPPIGRHRYFHKIYALDTTLNLDAPTKADLEKAMKGHVLAQGELVGTYEKQR